ncbi:MAG: WbqC family protein [Elusimicrobiota bacterium]
MIMAAHQPQYHPYLGYFHKIAAADVFIWLDDVQHKKREFQNRNRIRTPKGWMWLTVPVVTKGRYRQAIKDVEIDNSANWAHDHWESLRLNYAKAPQFARHAPFFEKLYTRRWDRLEPLCRELVDYLCAAFGIKVPFRTASEFAVNTTATRRLIDLSIAAGADAYLSGAGGKAYLEEELFAQQGRKLIYQQFTHPEYAQVFPGFEPNMSAVDFLFNAEPDAAADLFKKSN